MNSVGEILRKARIDQGVDVASFSTRTRIRQRYLEAIENGDASGLPSGFFYRSFVRQYASALGLNTAEIEAELEREREAEAFALAAALQNAEFPIKQPDPIVSESNRRYLGTGKIWASVVSLVIVLAGCSAVYAWWYRYTTAVPPKQAVTEVARKPPAQAAPAPQDAAQVAPAVQVANPEQPPLPVEPAPEETDPAGVTFAGVASVPAAPKVPAITPDDRVVVKLAATELTWISVTEDGRYVFSGVLRPNQSMTLGGKERTLLKIGNAGGVDISWNGKAIGPAGSHGQVRIMLLTAETYRIIAPDGSL